MTGKWRYAKTAATPGKKCKDCDPGSKRPAPHPGPRCATHHNEIRRARRLASKVRHVEKTYEMSGEEYDALYAAQGGKCAICRRATGAGRKRLAVDHDHRAACGHDPSKGCKGCTRGLLCSQCNDTLAHLRDDPEAFRRAAAYLTLWPTKRLRAGMSWPPVHSSV